VLVHPDDVSRDDRSHSVMHGSEVFDEVSRPDKRHVQVRVGFERCRDAREYDLGRVVTPERIDSYGDRLCAQRRGFSHVR